MISGGERRPTSAAAQGAFIENGGVRRKRCADIYLCASARTTHSAIMADPTAPPVLTVDPNAAAYPPQQGYPPLEQQGYPPQQQGYPPQQQGYPPQTYPPQSAPQQQPAYPPQAYPPPQAGYPDVKPGAGAPPPAYPSQPGAVYPSQPQPVTTTTTTNVVVVQQQPTVVQTTVYRKRYGNNDHGLLFAIIASCIVFWCGGWCGLICTIAGIFFALSAQEQEHLGNEEGSRQKKKMSYILSIIGLVVGFGLLFIYIISAAQ